MSTDRRRTRTLRECPHGGKHKHGTQTAYRVDHCGCDPCRAADRHAAKLRLYERCTGRGILIPSVGVQRRLHALAVIGWSGQALADRLGVTAEAVTQWHRGKYPLVRRETAEKIGSLYDELWDKRPPASTHGERISVSRTKGWAARSGFAGPLAWDDESIDDPDAEPYQDRYVSAAERGIDEIAVQEAMRGRRVHLYPAEKAEALRRLTESGYSAAAIADRLGTTQRSVVRTRSARGIRGAA